MPQLLIVISASRKKSESESCNGHIALSHSTRNIPGLTRMNNDVAAVSAGKRIEEYLKQARAYC